MESTLFPSQKKNNIFKKIFRHWHPECQKHNNNPMQFIYPRFDSKVYIPWDLAGKLSKVIFNAAHRFSETEIHWHLDDKYIGSTKDYHDMEFFTTKGYHTMTLIDEKGNELVKRFEVLSR